MANNDIVNKVNAILEEILCDKDLEIHQVLYKKEGKDWILRVFLDKPIESETEYISVEDCEEVTRLLSSKLDEIDLIDRSYNLEVSSPGLDRELVKDSDYIRFAGKNVEVKTFEQIDGKKHFEGILISKDDNLVRLKVNEKDLTIPIEKIAKINLAVIF